MADHPTHDDKTTPLSCGRGEMGIKPELSRLDAMLHATAWLRVDDARSPGDPQDAHDYACSEMSDTPKCKSYRPSRTAFLDKRFDALNAKEVYYVVTYDKLCTFPFDTWEKLGPQWRNKLITEGDNLGRSVLNLGEIVSQYEALYHGVGGVLIAGPSRAIAEIKSLVAKTPHADLPTKKDFAGLTERISQSRDRLANDSVARYGHILEAGMEYMRVRRRLKELENNFTVHRTAVIGGAENMTSGLQVVETTSFQALNFAATAYAAGNPVVEASAKISIAFVRAGAEGLGEGIADQERFKKAFNDKFASVMHTEIPGILAEAAVGVVCRCLGIQPIGNLGNMLKKLMVALMEFVLEAVNHYAFESQRKDEEFPTKQGIKLLSDAVAAAAVAIISPSGEAPESFKKMCQGAAADVVENIVKGFCGDLNEAQKKAKQPPPQPVIGVFVDMLPQILMRLVVSTLMGLVNAATKRKVDSEIESGATRIFGKYLYWHMSGSKHDGTFEAKASTKAQVVPVKPLEHADTKLPVPRVEASAPKPVTPKPVKADPEKINASVVKKILADPDLVSAIQLMKTEIPGKTFVLWAGKSPYRKKRNQAISDEFVRKHREYADAQVGRQQREGRDVSKLEYIKLEETTAGKRLAAMEKQAKAALFTPGMDAEAAKAARLEWERNWPHTYGQAWEHLSVRAVVATDKQVITFADGASAKSIFVRAEEPVAIGAVTTDGTRREKRVLNIINGYEHADGSTLQIESRATYRVPYRDYMPLLKPTLEEDADDLQLQLIFEPTPTGEH